jgi:hypothetical protein
MVVSHALIACAGLAAVALVALVALVHLTDNYHLDHVAGAWMGLAAYANDGMLYAPLHADGVFGGTRYMPLGIGLNAAGAAISGEYLVSGKLIALLTVAALLATVYVLVRRQNCERAVALGTVGAVIATFTALFAATTICGDALAVTLQLAAVSAVASGTSRRMAVLAGVLVALAFAAKFSALWGAATVLVWLLIHERRQLPGFLAAAAATVLVALACAELMSDGRFHENVLALGGGADIGRLVSDTPGKTFDLLLDHAPGTLLLVPFALVVVAVDAVRRRLAIVDIALVAAALVTVVIMTDVGVGFNHLLDLVVLVPLVVASGYGGLGPNPLRLVLVAALTAATAVSLFDLRHDLREAADIAIHRTTPDRLRTPALDVRLAAPVLSEDPVIPVERGETPTVLDSYMLLRVLRRHPTWRRELVARIARREFGTVVLITDLDLDDPWWSESHLGIEVATEIDRQYRFARKVPGPVFAYRLYVPRRYPAVSGR